MLLLWVAQTADKHEAKPSMKFIACLTSDNALTSAHDVKTGWQETVELTTLKHEVANGGG